jgi:enoyl-CoA hydratase/carnithine racemase
MKGPGKNALGSELMDSLLDRLRDAGEAPLLLTGDGNAFSAGLNLKEVVSLDAARLEVFLGKFDALAERIYSHAGPTVACVNGHAIAGGCVLALCCDYRIAGNNPQIRIGLNELALGVPFPPKALAIVRARVPNQFLHRLLLSAELYSPEAAMDLGIIDEVVHDALDVSRRRLDHLASRPAAAYAATKKDLNAIPTGLADADRLRSVAVHWATPEVRQRLSDALKK